jgi:hypothetical protein
LQEGEAIPQGIDVYFQAPLNYQNLKIFNHKDTKSGLVPMNPLERGRNPWFDLCFGEIHSQWGLILRNPPPGGGALQPQRVAWAVRIGNTKKMVADPTVNNFLTARTRSSAHGGELQGGEAH